MQNEDRLLNELDEGPFMVMLAMADLCAENSLTKEEAGWRYLAQHKKMPRIGTGGRYWTIRRTKVEKIPYHLPRFGFPDMIGVEHPLAAISRKLPLSRFLQESAMIIGRFLAQSATTDKPKNRRSFADMTPEEVAARRELRAAQRNRRETHDDEEAMREDRGEAAHERVCRAQSALLAITQPGIGFKAQEYREWLAEYEHSANRVTWEDEDEWDA